jgi:hypothetical protein
MRFLVVVVVCYLSRQLSPPESASVAGFSASSAAASSKSSSAASSPSAVGGRRPSADAAAGGDDDQPASGGGGGRTPAPPRPPEDDVGPRELTSRAHATLTSAQLRDLLCRCGAKVSGMSKRQLADRLGEVLLARGGDGAAARGAGIPGAPVRSTDPPDDDDGGERRAPVSESYHRMTLGELRDRLRGRGLKVSGSKRELVHRLVNSTGTGVDPSLSPSQNDSDSRSTSAVGTDAEGWSVLEPSVSFARGATASIDAPETPPLGAKYDAELPSLRGLLFVNKPSGYSTLPTKKRPDDPAHPAYPCLSDSVNEWLRTNPDGVRRLEEAREREERWWEFILRTMSGDPKRRRMLKRTRGEQAAKMSTFEPRPVHRLDVDTSGVVCIALTPYTLRAANMMFEKKSRGAVGEINSETGLVHKSYVALVEGTLGREGASTAGVIERAIGKVWIEDHNEWACDISDDGSAAFIRPGDSSGFSFVPGTLRGAVTSYLTLDSTSRGDAMDGATRVELAPHTGRGEFVVL